MVERTEEMKKITNDFYDSFASQYWMRHANLPKQSLEKFAKLLPKSALVLDLGCGGGRDAIFLRSIGFKPVCVDFSQKMCLEARTEKLLSVRMDQEKLCFKSETFDGVWSRVSLLHSPSETVPRILADLRLILKPRGVLFLTMKASVGQFIETELKTTEHGPTYNCYWPTYRLHDLLETVGFEVGELSILGKDVFGERNYFEIYAVRE